MPPQKLPVFITGTIDLTRLLPVIERFAFETPFGKAYGYRSDGAIVIQRHGAENSIPPHKINHRANLFAAQQMGVYAFALGSTGSLEPEIPPGSLAFPDDIFAPFHFDTISSDEERLHAIPSFDSDLRFAVMETFELAEIEFVDGGIYAQTRGPRFETPAEITWYADYASFVGMTCASELMIASELLLPYVLLVSVDNWGNGLGPKPLTMEEFMEGTMKNHGRLVSVLSIVLPELKRLAAEGFGNAS